MIILPCLVLGILVPCVAFFIIFLIYSFKLKKTSRKLLCPSLWEMMTMHATKLFGDDFLTEVTRISEKFDYKPWGFWHLGHTFTVISDCDSVSALCKSKNCVDKPNLLYSGLVRYAGRGMINFTKNDAEYKRHRKIVIPAYRKHVVESNLPLFNEEAGKLVHRLRGIADGRSSVIKDFVEDAVLEISIGIFSPSITHDRNNRMICKMMDEAMENVQKESFIPFYSLVLFCKTMMRSEPEWKIIEDEIRRACERYKKEVFKKKAEYVDWQPTSLSEFLLHGSPGTSGGLTDEEYLDEVKNLVAAGMQTTAFTLNTCLLLLALHPQVQHGVYEEMYAIFGRSDRHVEPEDLAAMNFTDQVIKETLRLYSSVPFFMREVAEDTDLNGTIVEKGSIVAVNIFAMHRNPKYYKDPLKFDPSRFSTENSYGRHPSAYIPFSYGYRNCPGQLQPPMVIKCMLCHIVRNFKIFPGDGLNSTDDIQVKLEVALAHRNSLKVRLNKRQSDV